MESLNLKRFFPYVIFGILCLGFTLDLSLFHHIPHGYEKTAMDLTLYGHFHAVLNYDSPWFLKDAYQPIELLTPKNRLQTRPGLVLVVAGLAKIVSPLHSQIMRIFRASGGYIPKDYFIPYFLFVLMNFLILLLSFYSYLRLVPPANGPNLVGVSLIGCLLIFNDVIKAFLLTPHTQLFNLLVPLVCLYALQQVKDHGLFDQGRLFVLAFLVGLGVTAYATFVLFLPAICIGLIWVIVRDKVKINLRMAGKLILVAALTVLPYLTWMFYVRQVSGSFYSMEVATQKQFVWILPLLRSNPLLALRDLAFKFWLQVRYAAAQAVVLPIILGVVTIVTLDQQHGLVDRLKHWKQFPLAALMVSALFLFFFAIDGEVTGRTAFPAIPPLIAGTTVVVIGMLRDAAPLRRKLGNGLIILLVLWQGWATLSKIGPFD